MNRRTPRIVAGTLYRLSLVAITAPHLLAAGALSAQTSAPQPATSEQRPSVVTTNRPIQEQSRRTFAIAATGVFAGNEFDGARLNGFSHQGGSTYTAVIAPENAPINESAWYAFKLWSTSNQTVNVTLAYDRGRHRYPPKISRDGVKWERLEASRSATATNGKPGVTLTLDIGPAPLWIAGQELFTSADFQRWIDRMSRRPFVRSSVIGKSARGRPIHKLDISEAGQAAESIVLLGRQHPPEVTGTFALLPFVETLAADTPLARQFRKKFNILVVPLINPDGVDAGHWRHNIHGVDLNRDWGQFNQPETRVVRDELLRLKQRSSIRFGIDFHSTRYDVFYTITRPRGDFTPEDVAGLDFKFVDKWLDRLQARVPDYKVRIEPSAYRPAGPTMVSAAWMHRELRAPAVTYEVGDNTDRELIRRVATASATVLMEMMLGKAP
jgi:cytosolic carboxypeptidase protein 6